MCVSSMCHDLYRFALVSHQQPVHHSKKLSKNFKLHDSRKSVIDWIKINVFSHRSSGSWHIHLRPRFTLRNNRYSSLALPQLGLSFKLFIYVKRASYPLNRFLDFFGTFVFKVISSQHEWKRDCKRLRDENFPPLKRDLSLIYLIEYYTICTIIISRKRAVIETMQLIQI